MKLYKLKIAILCIAIISISAEVYSVGSSAAQEGGKPALFSPEMAVGSTDNDQRAASVDAARQSEGKELMRLRADSGKNLSEMNFSIYSPVFDFGLEGLLVGSVVKFTPPSPTWTLKSVQIVGWSGFNNTTKLFPADRNFLIEVRDSNADLLYKFADTQNVYFASTQGPVIATIDVPKMNVGGDFYVAVYTRGGMFIGMELGNSTGNSYFAYGGQLIPAKMKTGNGNETVGVNWLIWAIGS